MGLLSIFKRSDAAPVLANEPINAVQRARTLARQRLIGAAVLLTIGIIGFPLVFETQPRPIPVDIPIDVPRRENAPALVMPPVRPSTPSPVIDAPPVASTGAPADVITESRDDAGHAAAMPPVVPTADAKPAAKPATKPVPPPADDSRARALLEGKPVSATDAGRFIVQVGAFADEAAARETRLKVEKLGLKTYTQVATTPAGDRIRVRVGPFGSRSDADKAMAKAKGAGLSAVVLTL